MIKIYPDKEQIKHLEEIFDVTRYIYNKTNAYIKQNLDSYKSKFFLRDKFVTKNTKKNSEIYKSFINQLEINKTNENFSVNEIERLFYKIQRNNIMKEKSKALKNVDYTTNEEIQEFEKKVSKTIRDNAVRSACDAYKSAYTNLTNGNIKYFNINYKKKKSPKKCAELANSDIKMCHNGFEINPGLIEHSKFKIGKRNLKKYKNIVIEHNCDLIKTNSGYYIGLVLPSKVSNIQHKNTSICGIDPGVRTFLTIYGSDGISEYIHNETKIKKIDSLLDKMKQNKKRKRVLSKLDEKKQNLIDDIHWKTISLLLKKYDIIFFGDIKSHNVVKKNKNKFLNRAINNLKFYKFKQRLKHKAHVLNKKVLFVNEAYTTQTCSFCGNLWKDIGSSKIYRCSSCNSCFGRDTNSAKNILMRGILSC